MTRETAKLLVMACRCALADMRSIDHKTGPMKETIKELKQAIKQAKKEGYNGYEI